MLGDPGAVVSMKCNGVPLELLVALLATIASSVLCVGRLLVGRQFSLAV